MGNALEEGCLSSPRLRRGRQTDFIQNGKPILTKYRSVKQGQKQPQQHPKQSDFLDLKKYQSAHKRKTQKSKSIGMKNSQRSVQNPEIFSSNMNENIVKTNKTNTESNLSKRQNNVQKCNKNQLKFQSNISKQVNFQFGNNLQSFSNLQSSKQKQLSSIRLTNKQIYQNQEDNFSITGLQLPSMTQDGQF